MSRCKYRVFTNRVLVKELKKKLNKQQKVFGSWIQEGFNCKASNLLWEPFKKEKAELQCVFLVEILSSANPRLGFSPSQKEECSISQNRKDKAELLATLLDDLLEYTDDNSPKCRCIVMQTKKQCMINPLLKHFMQPAVMAKNVLSSQDLNARSSALGSFAVQKTLFFDDEEIDPMSIVEAVYSSSSDEED